jgi:hypothetical protein
MSSIAQRIGVVNAGIEYATKNREFQQVCRHLMIGGREPGGLSAAVTSAEAARASPRVVGALQEIKAAVAAGNTANSSALLEFNSLAAGWLESLRHNSAFESILAAGGFRRLPLRTRVGQIAVGASASTVLEGAYKPVTALTVSSLGTLEPLKTTATVAVSNELIRFADPSVTALIDAELRTALGVQTDVTMFAELIVTGTPSQASAGVTGANALTDVGFLIDSVATSSRSRLFFIAGADAAKALAVRSNAGALTFPGLSPQGGSLLGVPLLVSDGIASTTLVLLDANQVAAGDGGVLPRISRDALVQLDTAPTGTSYHSLFQANATGVMIERIFGIAALSTTGVAVVTGIT